LLMTAGLFEGLNLRLADCVNSVRVATKAMPVE